MLKVMPWHLLSVSKHIESDLSNEVLYTLVGQEAAKILEAKNGCQKKICQHSRIRIRRIWGQVELADFVSISKFDL